MELPWKTYEINGLNEINEKAMKFISLKWDLWKSCENYCRPTSPIKKPWKLLPSNYLWKSHENVHTWKSHENTMKLQRPLPKGFKIDNTTVGSTNKSSQLLSFIPWGYFLSTIVSPNLFRSYSLFLGACPWYDVLASHCMWFIACDRETKSSSFCLHKLNLNGLFAAFKDVASSLVSQAYPGFRTCLVALGLLGYW